MANPLIQGKNMTGFTDEEEDFADGSVGKKAMPFELKMKLRNLVQNSRRQMHLNPLR